MKNGDIIKINLLEPDELIKDTEIRISKKSFNYKVKDLPEAIEIDPFEFVTVTFEGNDGFGKPIVEIQESPLSILGNYSYLDESIYSNGGEFFIEYEFNPDFYSLENPYVLTLNKKKIIVDGLNELQTINIFNVKVDSYEFDFFFLLISNNNVNLYTLIRKID